MRSRDLLTWLIQVPLEMRRRIQQGLGGLAVAAAVLVPGAIWYKTSIMTMSQSSASEHASMLRSRILTLRQQLVTEALLVGQDLWQLDRNHASFRLRRDLPFDFVVSIDGQRKLIDGFRLLTGIAEPVDLGQDSVQHLLPADSGFFDQVTLKTAASGLMVIEDRPMLIAVRKAQVTSGTHGLGFVVVGQWLDVRRLASTGEQAEQKIEIFSLANDEQLPSDVRAAISPAQKSQGMAYMLDRHGNGVVFTLIDDITSRPAMIAKLPWTLAWSRSGRMGFGVYYLYSALAGLCTWGLLFWGDRQNRKRVRRFEGLESLKEEHIATLVEAFPGYAFAVNERLEYVGVSRILAGVTAQEPAYFRGQVFGTIAHEWNEGALAKTFANLRDPARWPRVTVFDHAVEGLGERHVFHGAAHYLGKQNLLLVILSQKENPVAISATESHVLSMVDLKSDKKPVKNSAVA
jgi:hypothetical protein